MILLTDLFIVAVCCMILLDFKRGFFIVVLAKLFTPVYVRFILGPVSVDDHVSGGAQVENVFCEKISFF